MLSFKGREVGLTDSDKVSTSSDSLCITGFYFEDGAVAEVGTGCHGFHAKYGLCHVNSFEADEAPITGTNCVAEASVSKF